MSVPMRSARRAVPVLTASPSPPHDPSARAASSPSSAAAANRVATSGLTRCFRPPADHAEAFGRHVNSAKLRTLLDKCSTSEECCWSIGGWWPWARLRTCGEVDRLARQSAVRSPCSSRSAFADAASAATVNVCPGSPLPTVQAGVNAAAAGDTIQVCAGTFASRSWSRSPSSFSAPARRSDDHFAAAGDGTQDVVTVDGRRRRRRDQRLHDQRPRPDRRLRAAGRTCSLASTSATARTPISTTT